ncbi:MAG: PspA/IM30 family protein [Parcubacteria group bacterium]|nr:PspA/IM30 family protein [Parcubacteria group bacterium]
MSQSLLGKGRIAILAIAHSALDRTIDKNNVGAVEQMTRDLKTSMESLDSNLAEARGTESFARNKKAKLDADLAKQQEVIDALLGNEDKSDDHLADDRMAKVIEIEGQIKAAEDEANSAHETVVQLENAHDALKSKHDSMSQQLNLLRTQARSAGAKEQAAKALNAAADAGLAADSGSVDNLVEQIGRKNAAADEKFKMAMGHFGDTTAQSEVVSEVAARIALRKAEIAKGKPLAAV